MMKKARLICVGLLILFFAAVIFFTMPNLNPLYPEGLAFWAFVILIVCAVMGALRVAGLVGGISGFSSSDFRKARVRAGFPMWKAIKIYVICAAVPWLLLIVAGISSSVIFHVTAYREQMTQPEVRKFSADVQPLDVSQLPIVDYNLAKLLADKKLGEKPALGSQVTLGDPTIQKVDGKLVWVVPLEHSGVFKWMANMGGTPGYIVVSATNPRDVSYVDKYPIKYQPAAYLLDNLTRHIRLSSGAFTGLTDYSFELDDSGRPYWVVTTYRNRAVFSLPEATGVIVVDAGTGSMKQYSIGDVPSWVDRVQPADYITTQLNNRGRYIHGIFNFSNKDKFQTSEGYAIVYNNNRCYYFADITSVGTDESTTGFVLIDMVTKKPYLYQIGGATEYAAQTSAEGKVQNLHYTAAFPLITNVDGEPTYFMTLKDNAGLIKQYAFVSVKDYTTVGNGETISDALDSFRQELRSSGSGSAIDTDTSTVSIEGTVSRVASEMEQGSTLYKFMLLEQPGKIYTATYDVSDELALTKEGDKIKISCSSAKTSAAVIPVVSFENETLLPSKSAG